MRLVVIFAAGPVRHMSVRAGARAGETTDSHGQRPCKLATSGFAWSASAIHVGCAWNIRGKPDCDAEQMQFQGVCVANLADLRKPGRRGKGRQARSKLAGKRLGSSQRREIAFHDAQSRAGFPCRNWQFLVGVCSSARILCHLSLPKITARLPMPRRSWPITPLPAVLVAPRRRPEARSRLPGRV